MDFLTGNIGSYNRPTPKVSIVMPVYNSEKYLREAVLSILSQDMEEIELIIIDDFSTDGSVNIINNFMEIDSRIVFERNRKNMGVVYSRNRGLSLCHKESKYYAVADADNISNKNRIVTQYNFLENNPIYGAVGSNINILNKFNEFTGCREYASKSNIIRNNLLKRNPMCHSTLMIRMPVLNKVGNYAKDGVFDRDRGYDLIVRIGMQYDLYNLEKKLVNYRIDLDKLRANSVKKKIKSTLQIQLKWCIKLGYKTFFKNFFSIFKHFIIMFMPDNFFLFLYKKVYGGE